MKLAGVLDAVDIDRAVRKGRHKSAIGNKNGGLEHPICVPIGLNVYKRLRQEAGFGLIELLMAMMILNIGILVVVAAFNSGIVTLRRSGMISNASVLADKQMELYRSLTYGAIALDPTSIPATTPYTSDSAYASHRR